MLHALAVDAPDEIAGSGAGPCAHAARTKRRFRGTSEELLDAAAVAALPLSPARLPSDSAARRH